MADIINARIGVPSLTAREYVEIIQGEDRDLTFIVEGQFDQPVSDSINARFKDVKNVLIEKEDSEIERVCEDEEVQVFRLSLTSLETITFTPGMLRIEVSIDDQKARLLRSLLVVESIEEEGS